MQKICLHKKQHSEIQMKVIAINGSPHQKGNTWFALKTAGDALIHEGIGFEIIHAGHQAIHGCIACKCKENKDNTCSIRNDSLNDYLPTIREADGVILDSPVYYWNIIHEAKEGEAEQDTEGIQIMQVLGVNMTWLLKTKQENALVPPPPSGKICLNFVR